MIGACILLPGDQVPAIWQGYVWLARTGIGIDNCAAGELGQIDRLPGRRGECHSWHARPHQMPCRAVVGGAGMDDQSTSSRFVMSRPYRKTTISSTNVEMRKSRDFCNKRSRPSSMQSGLQISGAAWQTWALFYRPELAERGGLGRLRS